MRDGRYLDRFRLDGRVALVTGGAGILGRHFCAILAEAGARVAVVDLNQEAALEVAEALAQRWRVETLGIGCDVSSAASVERAVTQVTDAFGRIDVLHNNAASKSDDLDAFFAPFEEYSLDEWRRVMAVNVDGMFLMAQCVGRQMLSQASGGSMIQTASIYGLGAPDQRIYADSEYLGRSINTPAVYTTSKAAVIGLTVHLATLWADRGIRVNALTPGGTRSGQNEEFVRRYSARVPMGRMAEAEEMAGALLYLASDASSYVTGQNIVVDGGLSAW